MGLFLSELSSKLLQILFAIMFKTQLYSSIMALKSLLGKQFCFLPEAWFSHVFYKTIVFKTFLKFMAENFCYSKFLKI